MLFIKKMSCINSLTIMSMQVFFMKEGISSKKQKFFQVHHIKVVLSVKHGCRYLEFLDHTRVEYLEWEV